jgi:hypothetical protein
VLTPTEATSGRAPAASQRPVPAPRRYFPSTGLLLNEANEGSHKVRPSGLPLACGRPDGAGRPWAPPGLRTPPTRSRTTHARVGTGHRARTWNYTLNSHSSISNPVVHSLCATSGRTSPTRSPDARRRGSESGRADPGSRTPEIGRTRQSAGAPSRRHRDERFLGERSSGQLLEPPQRATPPFHARIHAIAEGSRSGSARQKEQSLGGSGAVATRPLAGVARTARMHQEHQSRSPARARRAMRAADPILASAPGGPGPRPKGVGVDADRGARSEARWFVHECAKSPSRHPSTETVRVSPVQVSVVSAVMQ